jgi:hypothetical protein
MSALAISVYFGKLLKEIRRFCHSLLLHRSPRAPLVFVPFSFSHLYSRGELATGALEEVITKTLVIQIQCS